MTHPDIVFYDFYEAWDEPNPDDKNKYLGQYPKRRIKCKASY